MNDIVPMAGGQQRYAMLHQGADAVARYQRKLDNRLDHLRHQIELDILASRLSGTVFDCTIGIGRFIGRLPNVVRYDGMDLSNEFVDFVRSTYPNSSAFVGNLLDPLLLPDAAYDNVVCLRSLSGIGNLAKVIPEMVRVTRPGGLIVLDYGRRASVTNVKGVRTVIDGDRIEEVLKEVDASVVERIYVDAILTRAKMYNRVFRFLNGSRGSLISDNFLLLFERFAVPILWQRQILVLRRNGSHD
jgi:SAM-dependent methyltransferase